MLEENYKYGLSEATFKQAKEAMRIALGPRDENGNRLSEEEVKARDYRAYYPVVTPTKEGPIEPMLYAEDFLDGKTPDGFHYELGQMAPYGMYNGMVWGPVEYENPIYNMPDEQYRQFLQVKRFLDEQEKREKEIQEKTPTEKSAEIVKDQPALSVQVFRGNTPVSPVLREVDAPDMIMGDMQVYERDEVLYIKLSDGDYAIANFTIRVPECRTVYTRPGEYHEEYSVDVTHQGYTQRLTIPKGSVSMVLKTIQKEVPACTISSGIKSANKLIENVIRMQTRFAEKVDVICCTGFFHIRGRWVYVHDNAVPPMPNVIYETGKSIPCSIGSTQKQAFLDAFQFLQIGRKAEVMLCLFLVAHLGPMFELFKAAGCLIRFVTALIGPSGSLKTAVVTCLYKLYDKYGNAPVASFLDTVVYIEQTISKAIGCVQIIDDLRPPVTVSESGTMAAKAEQIFRIFGDSNSKGRSSPNLQQRITPAPSCCGLITGEDIFGSNSSLLRCLILRIDKGDFDGSLLRWFQDNPLILQTHMYHFLHYCGLEGDAIVRYIQNEFPRQRALFSQSIREPRLVDTAAILQVMAQILLNYAGTIGAFTGEYLSELTASFQQSILNAVVLSENSSREMNPVAMYLRALFDMVENGTIVLASSAGDYRSAEHTGYVREGCWWLRNRDIYPKVTQYWNRMGVMFPLKERNILSMMADNGIIEIDYEKTKKLYSRKSSVEGQPRMMVMNVANAQEYLRQELGEF
ncbi:MAG: hypothetical protein IJB59_14565 [Oscillospiraceae bacterium]|nr:hypothetical protein [Oscillospiraceae bacterium]